MDSETKRKAKWAQLQARNAAKRAKVVEMAQTIPQAQIARELGLSRQRVNAILSKNKVL